MCRPTVHPTRFVSRAGQTLAVALFAWIVCIAIAFWRLNSYDEVTLARTMPVTDRPALLESERSDKPWTLVLAVHPQCPCTAATVSELERLLSREGDRIGCVAYVLTAAHDDAFAQSAIVNRLERIPGVECRPDPDGRLAQSLDCKVSGEVVLYDQHGSARFAGGITPARGHEGDNLGLKSIRDITSDQMSSVETTPVYGCRLSAECGTP